VGCFIFDILFDVGGFAYFCVFRVSVCVINRLADIVISGVGERGG